MTDPRRSPDIVVRAEKLGKRYRIGRRDPYRTLRETLGDVVATPVRRAATWLGRGSSTSEPREQGDTIWALEDVSFEVERGEVVGIIGRNGAGKSTLLKILSRITEPTAGEVEIRGRVASLLEVGTGFHPELTGRENVYLNGAILGMRRAEIERKFDEIVEFSGVTKFIDTPVKHYSSGMHVRLAFGVAAHLEPEILIVDEVLAVGDAEFQRKCLGKMKDVAGSGRTVLFVSHNMLAVRSLCRRVMLLDGGRIVRDGSPDEVVSSYLSDRSAEQAVVSSGELEARMEGKVRRHDPAIRFREIAVLDEAGLPRQLFDSGEPITVRIAFECFSQVQDLRAVVYVVDENGTPLLATQTLDDPIVASCYRLEPGVYDAVCTFPPHTFGGRRFFLDVHLIYPRAEHLTVERVVAFDVRFTPYNGVLYGSNAEVYFRPRLAWHVGPRSDDQRAHARH